MPCHAAISDKFVKLSPDDIVEKALQKMKKAKTGVAVVVDAEGVLIGALSLHIIFENILPVNASMEDITRGSMQVGGAPGLAKRLRKIMVLPVSEIMNKNPHVVYPETPTWEGIKLMMDHPAPIILIEEKSQKVIGIMSAGSALDELTQLQGS